MLVRIDQALAWHLPGNLLKDLYPRGMRRLAEHGLFRGTHRVRTRFGFRMAVNRLDAIKWCIYYFGQFEPRISRAFVNLLQPGDIAIDIGGNVGYHTLLAAKLVGPSGRVLAFEPSQRNFAELCDNIALNGFDNVVPSRVAVSDVAGTVELYFGGENEQGNSTLFPSEAGWSSEKVEAISFAQIADRCELERVTLIKIDVEGAEGHVIRGIVPYLSRLNPECVIFLEISPGNTGHGEELLAPFLQHGFHARMIENEYNPEFFRSDEAVVLRDLSLVAGRIVDVVLTRDPASLARLSG
ncbi:FkbM family methyltransferase [Novosphingobium sp. Gsoil 351]|uniref:FkbM family methyltransferase n=1 Tax=Novosphingobium sp. Gsoil 351 TaxID=2675225 RepID=UPI0012B4A1BB|nr:FkbM family methyltransferase [Novosphingobium sp. Gsoil 351]QGN54946.1 FkbM family methyltransferase [Novosphingobium sp. Gsoil 351]